MASGANNFYEVLGVKADASRDQIRRAYRSAARRLHPDTNPAPDAEARFKELARAYETLSDGARRRAYDEALNAVPVSQGPHFTWTNIAGSGASVSDAEAERRRKQTEFDEMYEAYFGVHEAFERPKGAGRRGGKTPPL